jgi:hypothetical protein
MNIQEYQIYCEDFFKQGSFVSEEKLVKEIANLSVIEFKTWNEKMLQEYNKKYQIVLDIINEIRNKENFIVTDPNIDWNQDPIRKKENKIIVETYQKVYNDVFDKEIKKYKIYLQKRNELQNYLEEKIYQDSLKVNVEDKKFIAEEIIDVYWSGWDCDNHAWLVNDNGQKKVVVSNHGKKYFTDKTFLEEKIKEYEKEILKEKNKEYEEAIVKTKRMLNKL